jgi:catechol 2,3-dioxygenase-like lactoylglutathione lyase family enzyme
VISSTAILASSDIEATLAYYKDVLGFESTWKYGDPPVFGSVIEGRGDDHFQPAAGTGGESPRTPAWG